MRPSRLGSNLKKLESDPHSFVNQLGGVDYAVGVIAGEHDGKVTVAQTKLEGMKDFAVVNSTHTFIMDNNEAISLVLQFLRDGTFHK